MITPLYTLAQLKAQGGLVRLRKVHANINHRARVSKLVVWLRENAD